ncbi:putative beta-lysine N-acetyltransferase [soil metagenome]
MNDNFNSKNARISVYTDDFNKRLRIDDYEGTIADVVKLVETQIHGWVEKLIVKSREKDLQYFLAQGFIQEAFINGYFKGEDMYFVVKYLTTKRSVSRKWSEEEDILKTILNSPRESKTSAGPAIEFATHDDARDLAGLYSEVFKVYPTAINKAEFVLNTMEEGTVYAFIRENEKIVSAASAEINMKYKNAELTDCASLKDAEGKGYMKKLVAALEQRLILNNIHSLYSIARAESISMNKVFHQLGYQYSGRMINNCYVYSGIEDMNVWWKVEEGGVRREKLEE